MIRNRNKSWKFPRRIFIIFLIFILLLFIQYGYLSLSKTVYGINMSEFATNRNTTSSVIHANRGTIFDREKNVLASNVASYTVIAYLSESRTGSSPTPLHVVDKEYTAKTLAPILNMKEEKILELLKKDSYQVELGPGGRGITELKKDEIEELNLPGIDFIEEYKRYYPNGDFASYIIGYARKYDDGNIVGELGIESKYNDLLKGTDGYFEYQRDRYGYKIPDTPEIRNDAVDGANIYLTIDSSIQRFLESAVKETTKKYKPEWMILAVMDAKTGEVLGSASMPSFDPNIKDIKNYNNPLISYAFEPGSTMKIYTYMCTMEKGTYKGDEKYKSGSYEIDDFKISDWNVEGWGRITYDLGFEYSSNVAVVNLLQSKLNAEDLRTCLKKYGFGAKTGIELADESAANIKFKYATEIASAGFGQGITTTAIQHLQALSIIANDGVMIKPHIVEKIVNSNNEEVVYEGKTEKSEKIVSEKTINKMKELMNNVVNGKNPYTTGKAYQVEGLDVIGKTGTAQIGNLKKGGYLENQYTYSFAGMYPKDDPEIIIYGATYKPKLGKSEGLAKATKSVMQNIAKYRNMGKENNKNNDLKSYTMQNFMSKNVKEVVKTLEKEKINVTVLGSGNTVINYYPKENSTVLENDKVILLTNDNNITMPDITDWSRKEVIALANILKIEYKINGYGYVKKQSIKKGDKITNGITIIVDLEEKFNS